MFHPKATLWIKLRSFTPQVRPQSSLLALPSITLASHRPSFRAFSGEIVRANLSNCRTPRGAWPLSNQSPSSWWTLHGDPRRWAGESAATTRPSEGGEAARSVEASGWDLGWHEFSGCSSNQGLQRHVGLEPHQSLEHGNGHSEKENSRFPQHVFGDVWCTLQNPSFFRSKWLKQSLNLQRASVLLRKCRVEIAPIASGRVVPVAVSGF